MLDVAVAYNRFKFLGNEFLTWFFFALDTNQNDFLENFNEKLVIEIGNRMILENRKTQTVETITISGENAGLEEAFVALSKGSHISEINLAVKTERINFQFNLKGESLALSSFKLSEKSMLESDQDIEAAVLEKIYLYETIFDLIDKAFIYFLEIRLSEKWNTDICKKLQKWILSKNSVISRI